MLLVGGGAQARDAGRDGPLGRDFDNWAVCDTVCFHLFDRTPHAFEKVAAWAGRREEFVKRAGFALLASVALHDKKAADEPFLRALALIERAAMDERNFVKKGVSWALRGIGKRNAKLKAAASEVAQRLSGPTIPPHAGSARTRSGNSPSGSHGNAVSGRRLRRWRGRHWWFAQRPGARRRWSAPAPCR